MKIALKRVYEAASKDDGLRVLVDRVWPRGVSKEEAAIDIWARDVAPSTELRKWFNHDPGKWEAFKVKYKQELQKKEDALQELRGALAGKSTVTFVYGAKDTQHNQAIVLRDIVKS